MKMAPRVFLSLAVLGVVDATKHHTKIFKSELAVVSPSYLSKKFDNLDHQDALFGVNPSGNDIEADVYYTNRLLCLDTESPGVPSSAQQKGYVLMIDRGGCSFVDKVRNAQKANATAVIIADDACLCRAKTICSSSETCQKYEPVMDDDGTGIDITIPSMILVKHEADELIAVLKSGTDIQVRLSYPIPKTKSGTVEYALWTTPEDEMVYQFLRTFKQAAVALGDKANFQPHMFVSDGLVKGCYEAGRCEGQCTNGGRYCATEFYYDDEMYDNKGKKSVLESLRRECIWSIYGQGDGIGEEWWRYVETWIESCTSSHYSTKCAESLYSNSGVDKGEVDKCLESSGRFDTDAPNALLEDVITGAHDRGVIFAPTLFVNGAMVRGDLTFATVMEAICWTFDGQEAPDICEQWKSCASVCTGAECIIYGTSCTEYKMKDIKFEEESDFDDDVFDPPTYTPTISPTSSPTIIPTAKPHHHHVPKPVAPPPAKNPTATPTGSPTKPPTASPSSGNSQFVYPVQISEGANEEQIYETIEIIEEPHNGGDTTAFFAGLGVGVGVMLLVALGVVIYLQLKHNARFNGRELDRQRAYNDVKLSQMMLQHLNDIQTVHRKSRRSDSEEGMLSEEKTDVQNGEYS